MKQIYKQPIKRMLLKSVTNEEMEEMAILALKREGLLYVSTIKRVIEDILGFKIYTERVRNALECLECENKVMHMDGLTGRVYKLTPEGLEYADKLIKEYELDL